MASDKKVLADPESEIFNPDIISQIASKLFNESPGSNETVDATNETFTGKLSEFPKLAEMPGSYQPYSTNNHVSSRPDQFINRFQPPDQEAINLSRVLQSVRKSIGRPSSEWNKRPDSGFEFTIPKIPFDLLLDQDIISEFPGCIQGSLLSGSENPVSKNTNNSYYFINDPAPVLNGHEIFDVAAIRKDFPIFKQKIHGKALIWFDNAATTQKPRNVIDAVSDFYSSINSNIHRGAHTLAARATDAYENSRGIIADFIGAASASEIIFVRGTTEGVNLIAQSWGRKFINPGDEIILTTLEHHANIVPWQMLAREKGAVIRVAPVNDKGEILLEEYGRLLGPRTRLVSITQASNALGTIVPVTEMIQMAKRFNTRILVDGAQSVAHMQTNVQSLDADFFVFSGHKIFGPTGIGALYIKREIQEIMPPWQGGGNMIKDVTFEETTYNEPPAKFEAGTPNVADAVGLGAAIDYIKRIGIDNISRYEHILTEYGSEQLRSVPGLRLIGTAANKVGILSFSLLNIPDIEVGKLLDQEGIAVRAGHHCAQPSLRRLGFETTVRPSLAFYNTREEIDRLVDALKEIGNRYGKI